MIILHGDQAAEVNHGVENFFVGDWNPELDCEILDWCGEQYCVCGEGQWVRRYSQRGQQGQVHKQHKNTEVITKNSNRVYFNAQPCCYCSLQASWTIDGSTLPLEWPQKGTLQFQDYGLQYRKGLELALKGITLNINEREKVNVAWLNQFKIFLFFWLVSMNSHLFFWVRLELWVEPEPESLHLPWGSSESWKQQKERSS